MLSNNVSDVYQLDCTYNALYIGRTKKKIISRTIKHQQGSFKEKWESSSTAGYCLESYVQFNWINPKSVSAKQQYHIRKIKESLEIEKAKANKRKKI